MIDHKIPYGHQNITEDDIRAVVEALQSDYLTQGPRLKEFERNFAQYVGSKYAVAVNNATSALHLAALALGVKPEDNVIVTPLTFASSANCIRFCGGNVTFCDIDADTYLMDLNKLKDLLSSSPKGYYKGVVVVDFAGYPHDLEKFKEVCDQYGCWLIEDACHAPGAWFKNSKGEMIKSGSGEYADISVFSFHPVKHIATGEGGMLTTNSKELYEKICHLRTHGITKDETKLEKNEGGWYYEMQDLGFNYRLTDFQAALGMSQLKRADEGLKIREKIAHTYDNAFSEIPEIKTPYRNENIFHAFHLYVIQVPNRKELYDYLHQNGIMAQVHYVPLHKMPYYKNLNDQEGELPVVEAYYEKCLSLPMFPTLKEEEQNYIIDKIKAFYKV